MDEDNDDDDVISRAVYDVEARGLWSGRQRRGIALGHQSGRMLRRSYDDADMIGMTTMLIIDAANHVNHLVKQPTACSYSPRVPDGSCSFSCSCIAKLSNLNSLHMTATNLEKPANLGLLHWATSCRIPQTKSKSGKVIVA